MMWPTLPDLRRALDRGTGSGVTVAILDTGVDAGHPAFAAASFLPSLEIVERNETAAPVSCEHSDRYGHGTAIAGIIHRIAPDVKLLSIRVLNHDKRQRRHQFIHAGAIAAVERGAALLNCSFSVPTTGYTLPLYKDWTDHAFLHDRHVVAASANDDPDFPELPAGLVQVLGVTDADLGELDFHSRRTRHIGFVARGHQVKVPAPGGGTAVMSGSSMAAAHLSGLLARIISHHPDLAPGVLRDSLMRISRESLPR